MSLFDQELHVASAALPLPGPRLRRRSTQIPPRNAPYDVEPGYYEGGSLWLYGNVRLLHGKLAYIEQSFGRNHSPKELDDVEKQAERYVLDGLTLVCGLHSSAHQRASVVPLRWGSPRIVVFSGGFRHHLGKDLVEEPFRAARLWRYAWDSRTDLAVSRRAPDKLPTYATHNSTVDRVIALIAQGRWPGLDSPLDSLTAPFGV